MFLILSAQYERWSLPLSVLLALPFGTFGALAAVWLRGMTNDVYFQIGLVTLLGLAAKNAILIVEFALRRHEEGLSTSAAAIEAARLRFRPILMTSLAFILGVLPLAISTGAGAGARLSVGTGVMGGMLAATFLAIFFVPWFFRLIFERQDQRAAQQGRAARGDRSRARAAFAADGRDTRPSAASRSWRHPCMRPLQRIATTKRIARPIAHASPSSPRRSPSRSRAAPSRSPSRRSSICPPPTATADAERAARALVDRRSTTRC